MTSANPTRTETLCASCGLITDREECIHCGVDPEVTEIRCSTCAGAARICTGRGVRGSDLHPEDGCSVEDCPDCEDGRIIPEFVEEARDWALGYDVALDRPEKFRHCRVGSTPMLRGILAALAFLDAQPALPHGFEPPPRPTFRPSIEQLDLWAAQGLAWRAEMKGFCLSCGVKLAGAPVHDLFELPEVGVCSCCGVMLDLAKGNRLQELPDLYPGNSGSPLWRRFDAGDPSIRSGGDRAAVVGYSVDGGATWSSTRPACPPERP